MRINTKARYAVMAIVDLGLHGRLQEPVTLSDIAQRQEISLSYLEQLFAHLRRAGLVRSVRGPGGGYMLARPAADIMIGEVVTAVDEELKATRCTSVTKGCMRNNSRCLTHDLWAELGDQVMTFLDGVSVADVCQRGTVAPETEAAV